MPRAPQPQRVSRRGLRLTAGLAGAAGVATLAGVLVLAESSPASAPPGWRPDQPALGEPVAQGRVELDADPAPDAAAPLAGGPALPPGAPVTTASASGVARASQSTPPVERSRVEPVEPPPPGSAAALLDDPRAHDARALAAWAADRDLPTDVRYTAIRQLERVDAQAAVDAALGLASDAESLVRLNAVAVLVRSQQPRAEQLLAQLDDRTRFLAQRLAARR